MRKLNLQVKIIGNKDKVLRQVPTPGAKVNKKSTVLLFTEKNLENNNNYYVAVPNLKGLTKKEASNLVAQLGLRIAFNGEGKVINQNLDPGSRVKGGTVIEVELK